MAVRLAEAPGDILKISEHPDYPAAVPTPDHFVPLLYLAGLAAVDGSAETLVRGHALGSISMSCYGVGAGVRLEAQPSGGATLPPGVPPDRTNV